MLLAMKTRNQVRFVHSYAGKVWEVNEVYNGQCEDHNREDLGTRLFCSAVLIGLAKENGEKLHTFAKAMRIS